jgi:hypothetical protein
VLLINCCSCLELRCLFLLSKCPCGYNIISSAAAVHIDTCLP